MNNVEETSEAKKAYLIVVLEWVIFIIGAFFISIFLAGMFVFSVVLDEETGALCFKMVALIFLVIIVFAFIINICLTTGVHERNNCACMIWSVIHIILVLFFILLFVYDIVNLDVTISSALTKGAFIVYRLYAINTINKFTHVLTRKVNNETMYVLNDDLNKISKTEIQMPDQQQNVIDME